MLILKVKPNFWIEYDAPDHTVKYHFSKEVSQVEFENCLVEMASLPLHDQVYKHNVILDFSEVTGLKVKELHANNLEFLVDQLKFAGYSKVMLQ